VDARLITALAAAANLRAVVIDLVLANRF